MSLSDGKKRRCPECGSGQLYSFTAFRMALSVSQCTSSSTRVKMRSPFMTSFPSTRTRLQRATTFSPCTTLVIDAFAGMGALLHVCRRYAATRQLLCVTVSPQPGHRASVRTRVFPRCCGHHRAWRRLWGSACPDLSDERLAPIETDSNAAQINDDSTRRGQGGRTLRRPEWSGAFR